MSIFELSVYDDASIPRLPVFFRRAIVDELWTVLRFLRIPTFSVMIVQGIFGGMPWTIMGCLALALRPAKAGGLLCGLLATWYYMAEKTWWYSGRTWLYMSPSFAEKRSARYLRAATCGCSPWPNILQKVWGSSES